MLDFKKYPNRGQIAELLVRKFLPTFHTGLYLQGKNKIYLEELVTNLE